MNRYDIDIASDYQIKIDNDGEWCEYEDVEKLVEINREMLEALIGILADCFAYYNLQPNSHRKPAIEYYSREIEAIEKATGMSIEDVMEEA